MCEHRTSFRQQDERDRIQTLQQQPLEESLVEDFLDMSRVASQETSPLALPKQNLQNMMTKVSNLGPKIEWLEIYNFSFKQKIHHLIFIIKINVSSIETLVW